MKHTALAIVVALAGLSPLAAQEPVSEAPVFDSGLRLSGPWAIGPRLDQARAGLSATVLDGRVYAAGGAGLASPRDALEVYDPETRAWRVLKPMPVGLERFGMTVMGDKIWVAGGYSSEGGAEPIDSVWSYDPLSDTWSGETALPGPKASLSLVALNDQLFALGGEDGAPGLFVYDPEAQSWNAAEAPAEINRRGAAAVVVGEEIWLIGGARDGHAMNRVDIYHTVSQSWRRGPDLPEPRAGHAAAVLDGAIHVFGGRSADMRRTLASHVMLEAGGEDWRALPDMPAARTESGVVSIDGTIWLIGGGSGAGFFAPFTALDAVDIFSPS
ncbi:Kelch repeat-containing protein [Oceanicaulis sp. LC35]|uniref:Kelch repeat-containing protein n=1 Tax=Oceanicaulis sp. LC35 TaxID=3349635 RepID=UPI003F8389D0